MLAALAEYFPTGSSWVKPAGGLFIWVELPDSIDAGDLLKTAVETEQVAFVPGHLFCSGDSFHKKSCMRLNFSNCTSEQIEEGIARLGRVVTNAAA